MGLTEETCSSGSSPFLPSALALKSQTTCIPRTTALAAPRPPACPPTARLRSCSLTPPRCRTWRVCLTRPIGTSLRRPSCNEAWTFSMRRHGRFCVFRSYRFLTQGRQGQECKRTISTLYSQGRDPDLSSRLTLLFVSIRACSKLPLKCKVE